MPADTHSMDVAPGMVFIDTEVDVGTGRVRDYGAVRSDGAVCHTQSASVFEAFVSTCPTVCGHNILKHDLKYLSLGKDYTKIDTLPLSPLLFPKKPYHRLLKDDKLQVEELNNPVNDAKKARDLYHDEVAAWEALPDRRKAIFRGLLTDTAEFGGFFKVHRSADPPAPTGALPDLIRKEYSGELCQHAHLESVVRHYPVELAYTLALIGVCDQVSMTPPWVLHSYPKVGNVMNLLRNTPCTAHSSHGDEPCPYCSRRLDAHSGLKEFFGYDNFRLFDGVPMQQQAVEAAIRGESLLTIFPTGGGKSLTFQLPALMAGRNIHGLTVVISPLQSLMKDQVDNLSDRGISNAATINGLLDPVERAAAIAQVADGTADILYIAPEMLRSRTIERLLLGRNVVRFVIDEAHCFSAWGQDFRTDYLYIGDFIRHLQESKHQKHPIAVSCFTATAKQKVVSDIRDYFKQKLGIDLRVFAANAERKNLSYAVLHTDTDDEKYNRLRDLILGHHCPTIVYVSRTKRSLNLAFRLQRDGISALPFNGKMDTADKVANQDAFMRGETQVIVATSAFGMGVDKKDVGLVVHYDISDSLENYIQEAGRAGRDPRTDADCYVLYCDDDLDKHFLLLNQTKLSISEIQQVWQAIKRFTAKREKVSCSPLEIAREAGWNDDGSSDLETRVKGAVAALEEAGFILRGNNAPHIFATGIKVNSMDEARNRLSSSSLFDDSNREAAARIIGSLISSRATYASRNADAESRIDYLADILGMQKEVVVRNINLMRQEGILADSYDMQAFLDRSNITRSLDETLKLEQYLLQQAKMNPHSFNYKKLNADAQAAGLTHSSVKLLRILVNFLFTKSYIFKQEHHDPSECVTMRLQSDHETTLRRFDRRVDLCRFVATTLAARAGSDSNKTVAFSMVDLLERYNASHRQLDFSAASSQAQLPDIEEAILYLSRTGLMKIEGGFMVIYSPIQIQRLVERRARYGKEQYRLLDEFYRQRIQQIHIVGEFANMMVHDYDAAMRFVSDYFLMDYRQFVSKYFRGERRTQIAKNITPAKYKQVFGTLSPRQREIIDDKQSKYIVVAAGPGSGKTRVLVHKLASLLLMEDVKHEQLLMLTFSRAAATEFRQRLSQLIGNASFFVDIKTFHSYSFDLLGHHGTLEESDGVVARAAAMIENGEVEESKITKSVLVIDEAQDMDADDFRLVQALMARNEEMRLITVGDDDQNIYAFRGSNSAYLQSLVSTHGATLYELTDNYRSDRTIVAYANHFVQQLPDRMKHSPIVAVSQSDGRVDESPDFLHSVLTPPSAQETTAILTATNEQALQVAFLLRRHGSHVRLIQASDGFRFVNLAEVRYFFLQLGDSEDGRILPDRWTEAKRRTEAAYASSSCLSALRQFFADFETTHTAFYRSDLREFALESSIEDFYHSDHHTVFVSTVHKAKGREFDNVHLLMSPSTDWDDERKRAFYVGITRARHNLFLYRHTPASLLAPDLPIVLSLSLHDVWLGYFRNKKDTVLRLRSGDKLRYADGNLASTQGLPVARLSQAQLQRLKSLEAKGYSVADAEVSYILAWRPRDEKEMVAVCLPNLYLKKTSHPTDQTPS